MYYDGSIASRLRELQRESEAAYARVNYVHTLLSGAYDQIRDLEEENDNLKSLLESYLEANGTSDKLNINHETGRTKKAK